ncbi:FecR family protein [Chitinophaga qingshengii]|uniref:FecR domain-containing protein n=1 Tax=Chitinophaga qingshengii TaxID=1569794 RepID=A0ABR7TUI4_9BACT|nr:FecR family protein [Chitinophaga qingshengii]MBC9934146.1 FecR domain-containing protein [Chitinophaga qingshengii]
MSQPENDYEKLLQRYLDGQCSPEELEVLFGYLHTSGSRRHLLGVVKQEFDRVMNEKHAVPEGMGDRIEARLLQEIRRRKVVPMRPRYRWWGAAAAVAVLLSATAIFYTTRQQPAPKLARLHVTPVGLPGNQQAQLTLSDGSVITLDSTGRQVIQQGNVQVQQYNGQLLYPLTAGPSSVVSYNLLAVPRGGQFNVVLPDGSRVWLNAASRLRYPTAFPAGNRTVEIQGQAYFDIKQIPGQPFIVKVNNMEVQVLGTSFDIMAYSDEPATRTTLVEGAVKVKYGDNEKQLRPGQAAAVDNTTGALSVQTVDLREATAWRTDHFNFENTSLASILRQLSRWYDVEADYQSIPADYRFGGYISRSKPLQEVLPMLETDSLKFKLEGRTIKVTLTR